MYDDLARTQRQSRLEWFVVNAVIPSVLATFALHGELSHRAPRFVDTIEVCDCDYGLLAPFETLGGPVPDVFPQLIRVPYADYPIVLLRAGIQGQVRVRALVSVQGRVASILVLGVTDSRFIT